jgi:hypothetical protein
LRSRILRSPDHLEKELPIHSQENYNTPSMRGQKLSTLNVGNILLILGLGILGGSFWLPYATAARVHRIEERASRFAAKILGETVEKTALSWQDAKEQQKFIAKINKVLGLRGDASSIYLKSHPVPGKLQGKAWWLESKHYLYMLTSTPIAYLEPEDKVIERPGPQDPPGKTEAPLTPSSDPEPSRTEVYAWPKTAVSGPTTVFFYCPTGGGAFHRNLAERYLGSSSHPRPGDGFFHHAAPYGKVYYGFDDQRWHSVK